ncbi:MAG: outer membrane beta-barrel protein, partial [Mucilaginibacter sp.]
ASYTLSKDTGTSFSAYSGFMDAYNWRRDYGLADYDITHNFTTSLNYALPFFVLFYHRNIIFLTYG